MFFNLPDPKEGDVVSAAMFRRLVDEVRRTSTFTVVPPLRFQDGGAGRQLIVAIPQETIVKITGGPDAEGYYSGLISTFNVASGKWTDGPINVKVRDANS